MGDPGPVAANIDQIAPPPGALILRTYHRILTRAADGNVRKARASDYPLLAKRGDKDT